MTNSPEPSEVEIVRQIVGTTSFSDVQGKIVSLDETTWEALKTDLPLWAEYRFDNETKSKLGEISSEVDPRQTRADYRNMFCRPLGYPIFNKDGSNVTGSTSAHSSGSVAIENEW